jgi:threonyl-tRNA synthetase
MIQVTFPDGTIREYEKGTSALQIAMSISEGLARNVLAARVNGQVKDAVLPINENCELQLLTWNDTDGKSTMWHSSAHLMAEALEFHFPGVKLAIGPPVNSGFYYDVDFMDYSISEKDLEKIEQKMKELAKEKNPFIRQEISKADAIAYFTEKQDPYKLELLSELEDGTITFYTQGNFTDLCRGPHIPDTGFIKAVKLTAIAGAYWRGDEKNKQLTRIYGVTFPKQAELTEHLEKLEEAKRRDHRKLGKELELFTFSQKVGQGLPMWLPKGAALRERLENFLKKAQRKAGYQQVITPHIRTPDPNEEFYLKPMNCPHHCEIFRAKPRSYKDLPARFAEFGTVYRYEQSGELHGLTRVRGFTQDDAHIFCTQEQVKDEFKNVIDIVLYVLKTLNFHNFKAQISLRDQVNREKYIGSEENWVKAEQAIIEAAAEKELPTVVEYGEAAFYGPKLDFMVQDALGREWQLGTIQVDYNLPERFDLEYVGADNQKHRPVMIHRAPFGSMERFVAVLLEHCAGDFPLWLSTEQFIVLPISDKYNEYAEKVLEFLNNYDIRGLVDDRNEKIGKKIRDAELAKVPFMLIVGEKEFDSNQVSVRQRGHGDHGSVTQEAFVAMVQEAIAAELS